MDLKELKDILRFVSKSNFNEFKLKNGDFELYVRKENSANSLVQLPQVQVAPTPVVQTVVPQVSDGTVKDSAVEERRVEEEKKTEIQDKNVHYITSPIIGTFYRAPAPGAEPFVKEGDQVSPGTVLCIVEAMKLMNEIECDVSGVVEKIFVENGEPVEYGEKLFAIRLS